FEDLINRSLQAAEGRTRASTEQIRAAIAETVESAAKRFTDATEEIRRTAKTIRQELDLTRAEAKKGVMELPEETKQSTSAMRRGVSEQINARKGLADIAARSGRAFDATERKPAPRAPLPQPPVQTLTPPPPAPAPAPAAAPVRPAPTVAAPADNGGQASGGWVKDLLRGASREDAAPAPAPKPRDVSRSPLHLVESLNSLSVDIAR